MIRRALLLALCTTSVASAQAATLRLEITPGADENEVVFRSKATVESFEGRTHEASGTLELNPVAVPESLSLHVQVVMASLDTGIALRNRHMRENHLQTEEFPHATFTAGKVLEGEGEDLTDGAPHELRVQGEMTIHGVTRAVEVPLRLQWEDGEDGPALRLESGFRVALADYGIPRPSFLFLRLAEEQEVTVALTARP